MNLRKIFWQGLAFLALVLATGVGSVKAAPYSHVNSLPEKTTKSSFVVSFDYLGDGGTVTQVDLYVSKDGGPFIKHRTTYDPNASFLFDVTHLGDGRYSFYAVAHTASETESKGSVTEAFTIVDLTAPAAPRTDKIYVNQAISPDFDEVQGLIDSVEPYARVELYSDEDLSTLVAVSNATDTGEWGPVQVGDNTNPAIWVVAVDAHGHRSQVARVENDLGYDRSVTAFHVSTYAGDRISLDYTGPEDVRRYLVEYRHARGSVWSARIVTTSTTPELMDLEPGRAYDVRVAPMDEYNNVGVYVGTTVRTPGTPVGPGPRVVVSTGVGGGTLVPIAQAAETEAGEQAVQAGEAAEAVAGEQATEPEAGAAEEAVSPEEGAEEEQKSSATPWVILAILIILAGIATGGYFYWFSGPEEVTTTVKPDKDEEKDQDKRW